MSNLERRQRIDELKERLFLEIKDRGVGGGGAGYGAPDIPSYNAPAPSPAPSYNNDPLPSYGAPAIPSYGAFDGFNFKNTCFLSIILQPVWKLQCNYYIRTVEVVIIY